MDSSESSDVAMRKENVATWADQNRKAYWLMVSSYENALLRELRQEKLTVVPHKKPVETCEKSVSCQMGTKRRSLKDNLKHNEKSRGSLRNERKVNGISLYTSPCK